MRKIAVFDSGWGGDIVADFLEESVGIVEVVRVIDWRNAENYAKKTRWAICRMVEKALLPQIGQVDVIVLASFVASCAMRYLRTKYPLQKFIQMEWPGKQDYNSLKKRVMILAEDKVKQSLEYRLWRKNLKGKKIFEPKCKNWTAWIDEGILTRQQIRKDLQPYKKYLIDTVILANTHLWDLEDQIEYALGCQTMVWNWREKLLNQVYLALRLDGASCLRSA